MNKTATIQSDKTASFLPSNRGILQRKCACGNHTISGGECTDCVQKKMGLQRKLTIGASNDPLEQEADRIADQVMASSDHSAVNGMPVKIQPFTGSPSEQTAEAPASVERVLASPGRPLKPALRQDMERRFGHDFSQVRVHTGGAAEQSARDISAHAYTVGNNVVFGAGRFVPETIDGQRLIAHELTHVVQQHGDKRLVQRRESATETTSDLRGARAHSATGDAAFTRAGEVGGYFINVGSGITISPEDLPADLGASVSINLENKPQVLPGMHLRELRYEHSRGTATIRGNVTIPHVRSPNNGVSISIDTEGRPSLDVTLTSDLPVFKNKVLQVTLDEQRNLAATLEIAPTDLMPAQDSVRNLTTTGGGTFRLANGRLSGDLAADLTYDKLGSGHFTFNFTDEGRASGSGDFHFEQDFLNGVTASLEIDEEANLTAEVSIPVTEVQTPIPGLSVTEGSIRFTMDNSTPGGALEGVRMTYNGFGEATINNAVIRHGQFNGNGNFAVTLPELTDVSGRLSFSSGILTGSVTIEPRHFPSALQVRRGSITATLTETGDINFNGEATIQLGPAEGRLSASRENDLITIGAIITLENIPGLQRGSFTLTFTSAGSVEGEADIATDDSLIPGLSGSVRVTYRDNLWSGETEITYTREDPSIDGSVTVGIRQTEDGVLVFHGEGNLTVQIIPGIEGTAGVVIDEESNVVLTFAFTQTEPYILFSEDRREREFMNVSRNIPLWAGIVVAVIRVRAGVRAGVGPGQIRNTRVEGTWEISSDIPPDFSINSEFYMPAFVEGYVAFGAGLGVDVLLGALTGGIEGVATAGLYGAISVVPELSYEDGDWMFEGTATLAAGARLKLSLNAWAEIEAMWVKVWERTWELASHTMPIGPDLTLRANVVMNLSNPTVPELTFEASDIDSEGLINSAMPADAPPSAGAREALQNRAEWSGRSRGSGPDASTVPPELADQANQTEEAPNPPAPPAEPSSSPPEAAEAATADSTASQADTDANATIEAEHQPTVSESELPETDQPRYPNAITLATLDEPPVPMPRTTEQEREDLEAAGRAFDLATAQTEDSEQLAGCFPRIQRRFQLTSIGYMQRNGNTLVAFSINPELEKDKDDIVAKGRGIAGMQTEIIYRTGRIPGSPDTVGVEMEAVVLGPDHPSGSGPSGQDDLMGRLVTNSGDSDQRYIKGHLLNDQVGGVGLPQNLFPITSRANGEHEATVENKVKTWISRGYWMTYKVKVELKNTQISNPAAKESNFVEAEFIISGDIIDIDRNPSHKNSFNKIISSPLGRSREKGTSRSIANPIDTTGQDLSPRPEDVVAEQERSTRHGGRYLDYHLKVAMDRALQNSGEIQVRAALTSAGLSSSHITTLFRAHGYSQGSVRDISSQLTDSIDRSNLTRINNIAGRLIEALQTL